MSEHVCLYNSRMAQEKASQPVLSTVPDNSPLDPALFIDVSQGIVTARKPQRWQTSHLHAQIMIFLPFGTVLELHRCSYSRTWQRGFVWTTPSDGGAAVGLSGGVSTPPWIWLNFWACTNYYCGDLSSKLQVTSCKNKLILSAWCLFSLSFFQSSPGQRLLPCYIWKVCVCLKLLFILWPNHQPVMGRQEPHCSLRSR